MTDKAKTLNVRVAPELHRRLVALGSQRIREILARGVDAPELAKVRAVGRPKAVPA